MSTPHTDRASGAMSAAAAAGPGHPVAAPSLRALVDAASPGPWFWNSYAAIASAPFVAIDDDWPLEGDEVADPDRFYHEGMSHVASVPPYRGDTALGRHANDAAFIAASREAVPLLLDVLEAARRADLTRIEYRWRLGDAIAAFEAWERER